MKIKFDTQTQLESSLLSLYFIMWGMVLMLIYIVFFMSMDLIFKLLISFNLCCGFALMTTNLIGQYQSYVTYMQVTEDMKANETNKN